MSPCGLAMYARQWTYPLQLCATGLHALTAALIKTYYSSRRKQSRHTRHVMCLRPYGYRAQYSQISAGKTQGAATTWSHHKVGYNATEQRKKPLDWKAMGPIRWHCPECWSASQCTQGPFQPCRVKAKGHNSQQSRAKTHNAVNELTTLKSELSNPQRCGCSA